MSYRYDDCVALALPVLMGSTASSAVSGVPEDQLTLKKKKDAPVPAAQDDTHANSVLQLASVAAPSRRKKGDKEKEKAGEVQPASEDVVMAEAEKSNEADKGAAKEKEKDKEKEPTPEQKEEKAREQIFELLGEDLAFSLASKVSLLCSFAWRHCAY